MPVQQFETNVRYQSGTAIIDLHGDLDASAEERLNAAYLEAINPRPAALLLNFSEVNYITSTGLALVVSLLGQSLQADRPLFTCGLSDHYLEIFHIMRLSDFTTIFPDVATALNKLNSEQI